MKKLIFLFVFYLYSVCSIFAEAPQTISYQAVIRNNLGMPVTESQIGIKASIIKDDGTEVYSEYRNVYSNKNGLISFAIGDGIGISTQSLSEINWEDGPFSIKCDIDLNGEGNYALSLTTELSSVPYSLYAEKISLNALPLWARTESKPVYSYNEIANAPTVPSKISQLELDTVIESDPLFAKSVAYEISQKDINAWNAKVDTVIESDPLFVKSVAYGISQKDINAWNAKVDTVIESDPLFLKSVAYEISQKDINTWNAKVDTVIESDPLFVKSVAYEISQKDINSWNAKVDTVIESDPLFVKSVAYEISQKDINTWNAKVDTVIESDPLFVKSVAYGISQKDINAWNAKVDTVIESDPLFVKSVAYEISQKDINTWNAKVDTVIESDPLFVKSVAYGISQKDINTWNAKVDTVIESDPLFVKSVAYGISQNDINAWNAKVDTVIESDPLFVKSVAYEISQKDINAWNAKVDTGLNVSIFRNDAEYISKTQLDDTLNIYFDSIKSLNNKVTELHDEIKKLNERLDAIETMLTTLISSEDSGKSDDSSNTTTYKQATSNSYSFQSSTWNYGPDVYNALKEGDRIIYICRHSERDDNCHGFDCDLNSNGVYLASQVGAKYIGGRAVSNDVFYGSTTYPRCKNTCFQIAKARGDNSIYSTDYVNSDNSIDDLINTYYFSQCDKWPSNAQLYDKYPEYVDQAAKKMINGLCEISGDKTLSWFTSHDFVTLVLVEWATKNKSFFDGQNQWINFMSGIAVIVHADKTWEVYPVRNLDDGYLYKNYGNWERCSDSELNNSLTQKF